MYVTTIKEKKGHKKEEGTILSSQYHLEPSHFLRIPMF